MRSICFKRPWEIKLMIRHVPAVFALLILIAPATYAEQIIAASYAEPVDRYGHFALGQPHEYARLIATTDAGQKVILDLPADEVFEDLAPRLVQLSDQAPTELLVIVSSLSSGARLALVGLDGNQLGIVAQSAPIGMPNRWLNPVGVADLNGNGESEIAAVTTPHIGGVLRVYQRNGQRLVEIALLSGFSNHVYRSPELGLSKPALINGQMRLLVPDVQRMAVRAIMLSEKGLVETDHCTLSERITGPKALHDCERRLN
jgi:hypothetical protein